MRILLVSGSFPPMRCGVGDYTGKLAEAFGRRKDTSVAVLTHVEGKGGEPQPHFVLLNGADGWRLAETGRILREVRDWSPDAIHFQFPSQGYGRLQWILPTLFRLTGSPIFLTLHEYYPIREFRSFLSALLFLPNIAAAGGIVVTRENYRELVPSTYACIMLKKTVRHIPIASNIPTTLLDDQGREEVRRKYGIPSGHLLSYFGFVSPQKGLEDLFRTADPGRHFILLACDLRESDSYHRTILATIGTPPWKGRVTVTGFLTDVEVGRILAASDAIVFPFRNGVNMGNGSLHGAIVQGTFILTTSCEKHGYDPANNVFFARPGDLGEMTEALETYIGRRIPRERDFADQLWDGIADTHIQFYTSIVQCHSALR